MKKLKQYSIEKNDTHTTVIVPIKGLSIKTIEVYEGLTDNHGWYRKQPWPFKREKNKLFFRYERGEQIL